MTKNTAIATTAKNANTNKTANAAKEKTSPEKAKNTIPFIELWSMFYLVLAYALTLIFDEANLLVFGIYFVCALPFFRHLDKFLCVCFLLSTMAYYFLGADEGIWSLYSILALFMLFQFFSKSKSKPAIRADRKSVV